MPDWLAGLVAYPHQEKPGNSQKTGKIFVGAEAMNVLKHKRASFSRHQSVFLLLLLLHLLGHARTCAFLDWKIK